MKSRISMSFFANRGVRRTYAARCRLGGVLCALAFLSLIFPEMWGAGPVAEAGVGPQKLNELIWQSSFIFEGTVVALHAATRPWIQPNDATAVVRVDEVLHAPQALKDPTGEEITVQLRESGASLSDHQKIIFFTNVRFYGQGLAVAEIDRKEPEEDISNLREQITQALQERADRALQERLATADLVVRGKVSQTRPVSVEQALRLTAHDLQWSDAVVDISSVEKGRYPWRSIVVRFPSRNDSGWAQAPKFRPGQEGIWILSGNPREEARKAYRSEVRTALDCLDFQASDKLERIRRMLHSTR